MSNNFFTEKERVKASFEKAAKTYDSAAVLQREVSDRMAERLNLMKFEPTMILDAGSGTGYGSAMLRKRYPMAKIVELDLAHSMLLTSKERYLSEKNALQRWFAKDKPWLVQGDLEFLPFKDQSIDMIWSNLSIQWINQPDKMFSEFHRVLKPNGLLMFSSLGPDTLWELKQSFGEDSATHVNQFIDMHDLGDAMVSNGFALPVMDMEKIVMTYKQVKQVMQDLKAIGAHNATQGRKKGLMGKSSFKRIEERYERLRQNDKLPATYEVLYGHAWRAEERAKPNLTADGRQIIEFKPFEKLKNK